MSFLQPIFLIAILAAGIPLILHLLTLRKLKVVPFSTLSFLKELQRSRVRAVRLRQLLLLLLRTLLVLLLVLAFARPALKGAFSPVLGGTPATDAVILLDDSYSMSNRDANGSYLRQAADAAQAVLDGLNSSDRVRILPLSSARTGTPPRSEQWVAPDKAAEIAASIQLSPIHVTLESGLRAAAALFEGRTAPQRELYVISDLQRGLIPAPPGPDQPFTEEASVTFLRVGEHAQENMSMTSATFASAIVEVANPITLGLRLRNHRSDAPRTANVSLFLESQRLDQRVQTIESGAAQDLELYGAPSRPGFQTGSLVLDGDEADFDNTRWFVLHIPEQRDVLVVGGEQETYHTLLALSAARSGEHAGFRVTHVPADRLTAVLLKEHEVFILFDPVIRDDVRRTLVEQIEAGKGAILLPSSQDDQSRTGSRISAELGTGPTGERARVPGDGFLTFGRTDLEHPLFEGMFARSAGADRGGPRRLESPDIYSYTPVRRSPESTTILHLSNGQPFLNETVIGLGRLLTYSVAFVPEWSSFPVSGLFVPLLHRSVLYVSGTRAFRPSTEPGVEITIPLPSGVQSVLQLRSPDGTVVPMRPVLLPSGPVFRTSEAIHPGTYSLLSGDEEIDRFAVNLSAFESDPQPIAENDLVQLAGALGIAEDKVGVMQTGVDLADRVYTSRVGTELWILLLALALVTALAETWLASTLRSDSYEGQNV